MLKFHFGLLPLPLSELLEQDLFALSTVVGASASAGWAPGNSRNCVSHLNTLRGFVCICWVCDRPHECVHADRLPSRTCSPALACHLIPPGPKGLLHQPTGTSGLSMDSACFSTGIAEVLGGQDNSACCGLYSPQDIRKDISPLVVARRPAPSLKSGGAPCLQMGLAGAIGGCSLRGQFSTLSLHFLLTMLWPCVHRGGVPWGAGRHQGDGLDWG